jgi:kumamolisin
MLQARGHGLWHDWRVSHMFPRSVDMLTHYAVPSGLDGTGERISFVQLGGCYDLRELDSFFRQCGIPCPRIASRVVTGQCMERRPNWSNRYDREVVSGLQIAGGVAPKAQYCVYFAMNTERGYLQAFRAAISDDEAPSAVCLTWTKPEEQCSDDFVAEFVDLLQEAADKSITICSTSGNRGPWNIGQNGSAGAQFPGSSPLVLSCGGTRIWMTESGALREVVWNDGLEASGGGQSRRFGRPEWQRNDHGAVRSINPTGRMVPDVAANAAFEVMVGDRRCFIVGTSAAAALWTGFIALMNQGLRQRLGHLNRSLYQELAGRTGLRRVAGDDSLSLGELDGWGLTTGLGTPVVVNLLKCLRQNQ